MRCLAADRDELGVSRSAALDECEELVTDPHTEGVQIAAERLGDAERFSGVAPHPLFRGETVEQLGEAALIYGLRTLAVAGPVGGLLEGEGLSEGDEARGGRDSLGGDQVSEGLAAPGGAQRLVVPVIGEHEGVDPANGRIPQGEGGIGDQGHESQRSERGVVADAAEAGVCGGAGLVDRCDARVADAAVEGEGVAVLFEVDVLAALVGERGEVLAPVGAEVDLKEELGDFDPAVAGVAVDEEGGAFHGLSAM